MESRHFIALNRNSQDEVVCQQIGRFALHDAPEFDAWANRQREYWHRHSALSAVALALICAASQAG